MTACGDTSTERCRSGSEDGKGYLIVPLSRASRLRPSCGACFRGPGHTADPRPTSRLDVEEGDAGAGHHLVTGAGERGLEDGAIAGGVDPILGSSFAVDCGPGPIA